MNKFIIVLSIMITVPIGCSKKPSTTSDLVTQELKIALNELASRSGQQVEQLNVTKVTNTTVPSTETLTCVVVGVIYKNTTAPVPSIGCSVSSPTEKQPLNKVIFSLGNQHGNYIKNNVIILNTTDKIKYSPDGQYIKELTLGDTTIEISKD